MIGKLVGFVIALSAAAAAAGVLVVSAAFAFYALLRGYIGPSGAAGCEFLVAGVVLAILAFILFRQVKGPKPKPRKHDDPNAGLMERLTSVVSERPIVAAGAAVAAGLLAWRNPTLVSLLLRVADKPPVDKRRR